MFWGAEFYCNCYKYFIVSSWKPLYIKEWVQWLLLPTQQFFSYITATKLIFNEMMMCTLKKIYFSKCNISEQIEWQNISASVTEMNTLGGKWFLKHATCVQWVKVKDDCCFLWNCWPSLSFHYFLLSC